MVVKSWEFRSLDGIVHTIPLEGFSLKKERYDDEDIPFFYVVTSNGDIEVSKKIYLALRKRLSPSVVG